MGDNQRVWDSTAAQLIRGRAERSVSTHPHLGTSWVCQLPH